MLRTPLLLTLLACLMNGEIRTPQTGFVRCGDGTVRAVYGLPGSFVLSQPLLRFVVSASFSDSGGIVATTGSIQILNSAGNSMAEFSSGDSGALVDLGADTSSAVAWLPGSMSLVYRDGENFHQTTLAAPPSGRVIGVRRTGSAAVFTVVQDDAVAEETVALGSGYVVSVSYLAGVRAPALRVGESIVSASTQGLEIDGPGGHRTLSMPRSDWRLERMTPEWVHVAAIDSSRHWAVRIKGQAIQVFELPGVPRVETAQ